MWGLLGPCTLLWASVTRRRRGERVRCTAGVASVFPRSTRLRLRRRLDDTKTRTTSVSKKKTHNTTFVTLVTLLSLSACVCVCVRCSVWGVRVEEAKSGQGMTDGDLARVLF
eukprot:scaffold6369_cov113-Isochrysis_galbana.AAC.5